MRETLHSRDADAEAAVGRSLQAAGGGTFEALLPHSELRELFDLACRFVDLATLIRLKRAAGRPKDLERIAELELIRSERRALEEEIRPDDPAGAPP